MLILGLSSFKRNPAAVLLQDGVVIAGIENDKLARSATSGIPELAIEYCLQSAQIQWRDIDALTVATCPTRAWVRRSEVRAKFLPIAPLSSGYYQVREAERLARELNKLPHSASKAWWTQAEADRSSALPRSRQLLRFAIRARPDRHPG